MRPGSLYLVSLLLAGLLPAMENPPADSRNFENGRAIPDEGYCDQPYIVVMPDGGWLCTLTTGSGREGAGGQHVVATRSTDEGRTWSPLVDIESGSGPTASWVVPLLTPAGRIYAFYNYNGDRVTIPDFKHSNQRRDDTLGWYVYRFSDDGGLTWSKERYRLPMPIAEVDRRNEWHGQVQLFWGIDKPVVVGQNVIFGFTRIGSYFQEQGEGWFYRSDNILHERDPAGIHWDLLPANGLGVRGKNFGSTQEEHNVVPLSNGDLFSIHRTRLGRPVQSYSRDGGRSWSEPELATYGPGQRTLKHPRACPMLWRTGNGKYLFWSHNNSYEKGPSNAPIGSRNVGWLTGGVERDGYIHWSQPEPVCYQPSRKRGASYPDLIETGGQYFLSATNKEEARLIELDPALLEGMWHQTENRQVARAGLMLELDATVLAAGSAPMPRLTGLFGDQGGFALDLWLRLPDLRAGQVLIDSRAMPHGPGISITTTSQATLLLELSDGAQRISWDCDPGLLQAGALHHVVFNVDVAPRLITVVVDGKLCDGGETPDRRFGYTRYADSDAPRTEKDPDEVSGSERLFLSPSLVRLRIYDRYLTTSESVGNFQAGPAVFPTP